MASPSPSFASSGVGTLLVVLAHAGCATAPPPIPLLYHAQSPVMRVPGAEQVTLNVTVQDLRADRTIVCARFDYGGRVATWDAATDPASFVQRAVKAELVHRGFDLGAKGAPVVLALSSFHCERKDARSVLPGYTDAEVAFDVSVYSRGRQRPGPEIYRGHARGAVVDKDALGTFDIEVAQTILQAALEGAIQQLFSDQRFLNALLSPAAQAPPLPAASKTPPPLLLYDPKRP